MKRIVEKKIYDEKILKYLPFYPIKQWEKEGISKEVMKYCKIKNKQLTQHNSLIISV